MDWYRSLPGWIPRIFVVDASHLLTLVMGEGWVTPRVRQNQRHVRPAKTRISLGIRPVGQSLRCAHEESLGPWLPFDRTSNKNPGPMGTMLKNDVGQVPCFDLSNIPTVPWNRGHGAFESHAQTIKVISHLHARIWAGLFAGFWL